MVDIERLKEAAEKAGLRESKWHYNRDGEPIDFVTWCVLFEDLDYRFIGNTQIGPYRVSTIWLGIDMSLWGDGPRHIFESMVFGPASSRDIDGNRYDTQEQALAGHDALVTLVRATYQPLPGEPELDQEGSEEPCRSPGTTPQSSEPNRTEHDAASTPDNASQNLREETE